MPNSELVFKDNDCVAVIGGGPAGSFFSYFLLLFAQRMGRDLQVDIYEPRDFLAVGPGGCNMCGGIISESLVQNLAMEGITLPDSVVQRGIDSYVLHTEVGHCNIATPTQERRIGAVHRGGGPRTVREGKWESFDAHLLKLATSLGAKVHRGRVSGLRWNEGRPEVQVGNQPPKTYDLLVGAIGVNSPDLRLFESLGFRYQRPKIVRTYITEMGLGSDTVKAMFGSSMHVFLLNLPHLDFAALIPKGDYVTLCLLGTDIDKALVAAFLEHPEVRGCLPAGWRPPADACHCSPKMYFGEAKQPFADRAVLIGDCGYSRLYKDGIGAAYRTAKAAARTAAFAGISAEHFSGGYMTECKKLSQDNLFGRAVFSVVHLLKHLNLSSHAILRMVGSEQARPRDKKRMSLVLWDVFTGSAPYRKIFLRTLHPAFLGRFLWALIPRRRKFSAASNPTVSAGGAEQAKEAAWKRAN